VTPPLHLVQCTTHESSREKNITHTQQYASKHGTLSLLKSLLYHMWFEGPKEMLKWSKRDVEKTSDNVTYSTLQWNHWEQGF